MAASQQVSGNHAPQTLLFEDIHSPGTYVFQDTGELLRIPPDAIEAGRSPTISIASAKPKFVLKLSEDPYLPITKARLAAADWDICCNF